MVFAGKNKDINLIKRKMYLKKSPFIEKRGVKSKISKKNLEILSNLYKIKSNSYLSAKKMLDKWLNYCKKYGWISKGKSSSVEISPNKKKINRLHDEVLIQ